GLSFTTATRDIAKRCLRDSIRHSESIGATRQIVVCKQNVYVRTSRTILKHAQRILNVRRKSGKMKNYFHGVVRRRESNGLWISALSGMLRCTRLTTARQWLP